jgi:hypothetical protein
VSQTEIFNAKKFADIEADIDTGFAQVISLLNPALFQDLLGSKKNVLSNFD